MNPEDYATELQVENDLLRQHIAAALSRHTEYTPGFGKPSVCFCCREAWPCWTVRKLEGKP